MERSCLNCVNWGGKPTSNPDASYLCEHFHVSTYGRGTCPACKTADMSDSEVAEQVTAAKKKAAEILATVQPAKAKQVTKRKSVAEMTQAEKDALIAQLVEDEVARSERQLHKGKLARLRIVEPNPNIKMVKLFDHQRAAFDKLKDSDDIALFFEMGCGKTITCLSIMWYKWKRGDIKGLLVVAPNDVHKQWYNDIVNPNPDVGQVFDEPIQVQCVGGRGGQKELYPFERDDLFKFVSVNVDTFSTPNKWMEIVAWANDNNYAIAVDEATVIKNPDSKRSQRLLYEFNDVVRRRKTVIASKKKHPVRAVLTGTPVTNGPIDLWAIMEFVHPNFFGLNYYSFRQYYAMMTRLSVEYTTPAGDVATREVQVMLTDKTWQGIHDAQSYEEAFVMFGCSEETYMLVKHQNKFIGPYKHADELKYLLEPVSVFAKLVDCVDMPAVSYVKRVVQMSPEQDKLYKQMKKDLLAKYDDHVTDAKTKLVVTLRLQQISSGFIIGHKDLAEDDWSDAEIEDDIPLWSDDAFEGRDIMPDEVVWIGSSNPKLDALMRDIDETAKPLLVLTQYSAEAAKIYELCKDKYKTCLITGWKNIGSIDEFKEGKYEVMIANMAKIARGFNLQIAHTTMFYSNSFSMELRQQAEFRTFRIGQKHPCQYIDYTCSDIDETVIQALALKKGLLDYMRNKNIAEVV